MESARRSEAGGAVELARFLIANLLLVVSIGLVGVIAMGAMMPSGIPAAWSDKVPGWIWSAMAWSMISIPLAIIAILVWALTRGSPGRGVKLH